MSDWLYPAIPSKQHRGGRATSLSNISIHGLISSIRACLRKRGIKEFLYTSIQFRRLERVDHGVCLWKNIKTNACQCFTQRLSVNKTYKQGWLWIYTKIYFNHYHQCSKHNPNLHVNNVHARGSIYQIFHYLCPL